MSFWYTPGTHQVCVYKKININNPKTSSATHKKTYNYITQAKTNLIHELYSNFFL